MMLNHTPPSKWMFITGVIVSTMMMMMAHSWIMVWFSMELNLMFFLPTIMKSEDMSTVEIGIKYFFFQSLGSYMFILSLLWSYSPSLFSSSFMTMSLMMKMGGAPCHQWFPSTVNSQPLFMVLLLTTSQKLPIIMIMTTMMSDWDMKILTLLVTSNLIVGSLGGLNQSQMKSLLAYSSINSLGWLLVGGLINLEIVYVYFSVYTVNMMLVLWSLHLSNTQSIKWNSAQKFSSKSALLSMLFIMSLWGAPPLIGFMPKMMVLSYTLGISLWFTIVMIVTSMISLYYYGMVFIIMAMSAQLEKAYISTPSNKMLVLLLISISSLFALMALQ